MNEAKAVDSDTLKTYANNALVTLTSMTPEQTEVNDQVESDIYAGYLTDDIQK